MKRTVVPLAEREGLQSVIDNARKSAALGYSDFTATNPAAFDADFIFEKEREGMSLHQALQVLVALKRSRRS